MNVYLAEPGFVNPVFKSGIQTVRCWDALKHYLEKEVALKENEEIEAIEVGGYGIKIKIVQK